MTSPAWCLLLSTFDIQNDPVGAEGSGRAGSSWVRSARCVSEAHCVEVQVGSNVVVSRSSLRPSVTLELSRDQWSCFVAHVKTGAFDLPQ